MVALHCLHVALHSIAFSPAVRCYSLQCMHKGMIVRRFVTEQKKTTPITENSTSPVAPFAQYRTNPQCGYTVWGKRGVSGACDRIVFDI
jgi:hypothetical protein